MDGVSGKISLLVKTRMQTGGGLQMHVPGSFCGSVSAVAFCRSQA